jgi:hypothetical protein
MAREIDATEIVWLSVLRGKSAQETREEVEREIGREYKQNYINSLRAGANRLIRARADELKK